MKLVLIILGIVVVAILLLRLEVRSAFRDRVRQLFYYAPDSRPKLYHESQLAGLPDPVQRYFKQVLQDGQPYVFYARLKHTGRFKSAQNKAWSKIQGEQYFTIERPGFVWKGTTPLFTAQDLYLADRGRLVVYLFSMLKIVDQQDKNYDEAELQRWLSEASLFPVALLPSSRLSWQARDERSAVLHFRYQGHQLECFVTFNEEGFIESISTERLMKEGRKETWIGEFADYQTFGPMKVPTRIKATWLLDEGPYTYADFEITQLEYDQPWRF